MIDLPQAHIILDMMKDTGLFDEAEIKLLDYKRGDVRVYAANLDRLLEDVLSVIEDESGVALYVSHTFMDVCNNPELHSITLIER
jgi:hypothetical protein